MDLEHSPLSFLETLGRRFLLRTTLLLLWGLPCLASGQVCQGVTMPLLPMSSSYEVLVVSSTPVPLTASKYSQGGINAALAQLSVEEGTLSFTVDGTTPSATVGHQLTVGTMANLCGLPAIQAFRAVQVSSSVSALKVTYWKTQ
jgi:hypothetical protein